MMGSEHHENVYVPALRMAGRMWKGEGCFRSSLMLTAWALVQLLSAKLEALPLPTSQGLLVFMRRVMSINVLTYLRFVLMQNISSRWRTLLAGQLLQRRFSHGCTEVPDQAMVDHIEEFVRLCSQLLEGIGCMSHVVFAVQALRAYSRALCGKVLLQAAFWYLASHTLTKLRVRPAQERCVKRREELRTELAKASQNAETIALQKGWQRELQDATVRIRRVEQEYLAAAYPEGLLNAFSFAAEKFCIRYNVPDRTASEQGHDHDLHEGHGHGHSHSVDHGIGHGHTHGQTSCCEAAQESMGSSIVDVYEQLGNFFWHVSAGVSGLGSASKLAVVGSRLDAMYEVPQAKGKLVNRSSEVLDHAEMWLKLRDVDLAHPDGGFLVKGLNLQLGIGQSLLITGPSGVGKTSLMRAIAGICTNGSGHILCHADIMVLPQATYMCSGTLKQLLLYPDIEAASEIYAEKTILAALDGVLLSHLASEHGLHVERNWEAHLSRGEKQRISFARVLLRKPCFLLLDEATCSLDPAAEELVYTSIQQVCKSWVSIGHGSTLEKYHGARLTLSRDGTWRHDALALPRQ